ncbi:MAG: metal-dependent transcriptional regulator [Acidobacteria bacterium]|nr:metal-dependent transcriptional regulator [Acidobacteriota bacterium]
MAAESQGKATVSSTVEDYLKVVLKIEDMKQRASTSRVARHLDVADATVTDMLRKLKKAGLLEYKPYYGATLTRRGRQVAVRILRRHRLLEMFLHQVLGYGWEQVHQEAERLEHAVSDLFISRIDALLDFPVQDPHGETIPDARGFRKEEDDLCLAEAEPGSYSVRKVTNSDPEFLAYLDKVGLRPATRFSLQEKSPFQGPLKLLTESGREPVYLGLEACGSIFVLPVKDRPPAPQPDADGPASRKAGPRDSRKSR